MPSFGGMSRRPIGRRERCRLDMVPPIGGTVPGGAVLGSREQSADWRTVLAGRQTGADRNWGLPGRECGYPGTRMSGNAELGNAELGNADVLEHAEPGGNADVRGCGAWECGAWECGCLGACGVRGLPAGPIGPAGTVPGNCPARSMVPPIGGTVYRRRKWCRQSAARFRRRPAEPPADWPAARSGGVACGRTLRRPGVPPSCGTAGAARPVWCRLDMVPPTGGAVHGGTVLPGGCGLACMVPAIGGAVSGRRGSLGTVRFRGLCGPGRGGMSKNSLLAWMTRADVRGRYWGRPLGNGVWKNGAGGTASGCGGLPGWRRGSGGCRGRRVWRRSLENGVWGTASGCGVWERKAGAEAEYPSKDAGKLKRNGAARKQGMQGVVAAKRCRGNAAGMQVKVIKIRKNKREN